MFSHQCLSRTPDSPHMMMCCCAGKRASHTDSGSDSEAGPGKRRSPHSEALLRQIVTDILYLANQPIDTRLALKMKPRKLAVPIPEDPADPLPGRYLNWETCPLMLAHNIILYHAICMKGECKTKPYPDIEREDYLCSHHQLEHGDSDTWLCHADFHALYYGCHPQSEHNRGRAETHH